MKRPLALAGLLFLGLLLLIEPDTGLVAVVPNDSAQVQPVQPVQPAPTTAEPPATTTTDPVATTSEPGPESTTTTAVPMNAFAGDPVETRFGIFQVEILVRDGRLVDVVTVSQPGDRRSRRINETAIPLYEEAAISSQSADVDAISGATITWQAYTASLQSALDQVGL